MRTDKNLVLVSMDSLYKPVYLAYTPWITTTAFDLMTWRLLHPLHLLFQLNQSILWFIVLLGIKLK